MLERFVSLAHGGRHREERTPASGRRTRVEGWQGGFISYRLKGSQSGGKRVSVAMATEPALYVLDVYLNARELRDVIFTPVFSSLFLPFSFVEDALGDNVILSAPCFPLPPCRERSSRGVCVFATLFCPSFSLFIPLSLLQPPGRF